MFSAVDVEACLVFEHSFGLDVTLVFERPRGWEYLLSFFHLYSWYQFPVLLFSVSVEFIDDGLLKLSFIGCFSGFTLVQVSRVVACSEGYGIRKVLFHPQVVFVHGVIVVVTIFF